MRSDQQGANCGPVSRSGKFHETTFVANSLETDEAM